MNRAVLCAVLVAGICAAGFSQEEARFAKYDIWFSTGPAFGNYFMSGKDLENGYTGSPGVQFSLYALFGERNIGLFLNYGVLFPVVNNTEREYEPSVQLDFILAGVGFGHDINENLTLHLGAGPNMNMPFLHYKENGETLGDYFIGLGIGGDVGLKYKLVQFICIDAGTTLTYNFAAYRETRRNIDFRNNDYEKVNAGWVKRYSMFGVKPYAAICVNFSNRQ